MDFTFLNDSFFDLDGTGMEPFESETSTIDSHIVNWDTDVSQSLEQGEYEQNYLIDNDVTLGFDDWNSGIHGTPIEDATIWHEQTTGFTCGVVSAEMVMKTYGIHLSEAELVYEATEAGYLTSNGISIDGVRYLLELHGVNTQMATGGTIEELTNFLDQGHKIIVPVDSGEIWNEDSRFEDIYGEKADHAVVVTGIEYGDDKSYVILNDPGHPDGQGLKVDLDLFTDAWKDSGYTYIKTDSPLA